MTDEQLRRVLAGAPLVSDEEHEAQRTCSCGRRYPIPDLAKQCKARHG